MLSLVASEPCCAACAASLDNPAKGAVIAPAIIKGASLAVPDPDGGEIWLPVTYQYSGVHPEVLEGYVDQHPAGNALGAARLMAYQDYLAALVAIMDGRFVGPYEASTIAEKEGITHTLAYGLTTAEKKSLAAMFGEAYWPSTKTGKALADLWRRVATTEPAALGYVPVWGGGPRRPAFVDMSQTEGHREPSLVKLATAYGLVTEGVTPQTWLGPLLSSLAVRLPNGDYVHITTRPDLVYGSSVTWTEAAPVVAEGDPSDLAAFVGAVKPVTTAVAWQKKSGSKVIVKDAGGTTITTWDADGNRHTLWLDKYGGKKGETYNGIAVPGDKPANQAELDRLARCAANPRLAECNQAAAPPEGEASGLPSWALPAVIVGGAALFLLR